MNDSPPSSGSSRFPTFAPAFRWLLGLPGWFFGRRRLWRGVGRVMVGLAVLATLIVLVCAEENLRGKWAWDRYKHKLEAQGEKLDWKDYVPPPVSDAQNFAMTPFLAPLFDFNPKPLKEGQSHWRDTKGFERADQFGHDLMEVERMVSVERAARQAPLRYGLQKMTDVQVWARGFVALTNPPEQMTASEDELFRRRYGLEGRAPVSMLPRELPPEDASAIKRTRPEAAAEVLRGLAKYKPVLEELRSASQRPYARFNIRYDEEDATAIMLPHVRVLERASQAFQLRASAELALDQTDAAWADAQMVLYLADTLEHEPLLVSKAAQLRFVQLALQPIWEGLAERRWSEAQLANIQQRLARLDLLAGVTMRGQRAFDILTIDQMRRQVKLDPVDYSRRVVSPPAFLLGGLFYQNQLWVAQRLYEWFVLPVDVPHQRLYPSALTNAMPDGFKPFRMIGERLLGPPGYALNALSWYGFGQTRVNEATIACALERYRQAEGQFPESLAALSPRYLQKMPHDIITGTPLKYRRTPDGQFVLYSVVWNEKDDGGLVVLPETKEGAPERKSGWELTAGDWVWQYPARAEKAAQQ
jgi:hypothetical protein